MFHVYVLKSLKDGRYYIGYTKDIVRRIEDHNRGKSKSVKNRGPFQLIWVEPHINENDAINREQQIKKYKGGNAFKKLINRASNPTFLKN